jgi:transcriptional regulator with XRE-family HTH domain
MPAKKANEPNIIGEVRQASAPRSENFHLGKRLRALRRARGVTLDEAGRLTGLAASTLSKIENNQMSPTFDVVQKLASGLELDITELFAGNLGQDAAGRRSITLAGTGRPMETSVYEHRLIAAELKHKKILPFVTTIKARSLDDFSVWSQHSGEEFLFVLEGEICFHTAHYEAATLGVGDSVYIDSNMQHACFSTSEADAVVLWVNTG